MRQSTRDTIPVFVVLFVLTLVMFGINRYFHYYAKSQCVCECSKTKIQ